MAGIAVGELTATQRVRLRELLHTFAGNLRGDLAAAEINRLDQAGFDRLHLAWAGSVESGKTFYYRLHGPTLIIELDTAHDDPNHVHTVWHGPDDFGVDVLRLHLQRSHRPPS